MGLTQSEALIRTLSEILQILREGNLEDRDNFALRLARAFNEDGGRFIQSASALRTDFFRLNRVKRKPFIDSVVKRLGNVDRSPTPSASFVASYVPVDEIDSFRKVRAVSSARTIGRWREMDVKKAFLEIIGEPFVQKDWGGEKSDLFTTRVKYGGIRVPAAFAFKGRGTRGALTIAKLGKNGDQIVRLFEEPAALYVLQSNERVHNNVYKAMEAHAVHRGLQTGTVHYSVIDGIDTRRVLEGYGKI